MTADDDDTRARLLAAYSASRQADDGRVLTGPDRYLLRVLNERDAALAKIARVEALLQTRALPEVRRALDGPSGGETE